jgi:hypothetical protein
LLREREPVYALADIQFESEEGPHIAAVDNLIAQLTERGVWVP